MNTPRSFLFATLLSALFVSAAYAQGERRESLAGEKAEERAKLEELPNTYNLHLSRISYSIGVNLRTEFSDNAFYTKVNRKNDFAIRPEARFKGTYPITDINSLTMSLGVGYAYHTFKELNGDSPLINPDSELALLVYSGNFRFRLSDRFSYQETLYYGSSIDYKTGDFINLNNLGVAQRFKNNAGLMVDWDLNDLVLNFAYSHENFISFTEVLNYLTRASEKVTVVANLYATPKIRYGLESEASWNDYETKTLPDHWRTRVGPFLDVPVTPVFNFRVGAGYETVLFASTAKYSADISDYYAYGRVAHRFNQFLTYGLSAGHENQLGWSAANNSQTYVRLNFQWFFLRQIELSNFFSMGLANEYGGPYREEYSYYQPGLQLGWHVTKRSTVRFSYTFTQKDSANLLRNYYENRLSLAYDLRW